jgi:hypothetical protein
VQRNHKVHKQEKGNVVEGVVKKKNNKR